MSEVVTEDRLKEIKHYITTVYQGHIARGHFDWLISEFEREREAADTVRLSNRELLKVVDKQDATITTLREALGGLGNYLRVSKWMNGAGALMHTHGFKMDDEERANNEKVWADVDKALATAKEGKDVR